MPPTAAPFPSGFPQGRKPRRPVWLWVALGLLLAIVVSAATGSIVTFAAVHNATGTGRATIVCTISVDVCAYNSAIQRG